MRTLRWALGAVGVALAAYGGWLVVTRQEPGQLVEVAVWLAAGVVLHDVALAGLVVLVTLAGRRLLPPAWRAPAGVALVVWGSVSLVALPVLGRFGARPDNPTLLDRPYLVSWAGLTLVTVLVATAAGWLRTRAEADRSSRSNDR